VEGLNNSDGWRGLELSQVEFRAPGMAICRTSRGTDICMNGCEGMRVHWSEFVVPFYEIDTFLPSFLPCPVEPGSIVLKREAVYVFLCSFRASKQASCTAWFET
jgi:hypothetical protein